MTLPRHPSPSGSSLLCPCPQKIVAIVLEIALLIGRLQIRATAAPYQAHPYSDPACHPAHHHDNTHFLMLTTYHSSMTTILALMRQARKHVKDNSGTNFSSRRMPYFRRPSIKHNQRGQHWSNRFSPVDQEPVTFRVPQTMLHSHVSPTKTRRDTTPK